MTLSESMKIGRRQHRRMLRAGIAYQEDRQQQVGTDCARNVGNHTALAIRLCTSPPPRRSQILNYGTFGTVSAGTGCTATTGFETRRTTTSQLNSRPAPDRPCKTWQDLVYFFRLRVTPAIEGTNGSCPPVQSSKSCTAVTPRAQDDSLDDVQTPRD